MRGFAVFAICVVAASVAVASATKTVDECVAERAQALKANVVPAEVGAMVREIEAKYPFVAGVGWEQHAEDIKTMISASLLKPFCWAYIRPLQVTVLGFERDGCNDVLDEQDPEAKAAMANPVMAEFVKATDACMALN